MGGSLLAGVMGSLMVGEPAAVLFPFDTSGRICLWMALSAATCNKLPSVAVFCVYRELNFTTALTALNVATFRGRGFEVTRKVRPSAQGGVVKEPVYWNRGVV